MASKPALNRTELTALHDKISSALTQVIETDSDLMGMTDLDAGLFWSELSDVKTDIVAAMFGQVPSYLRANVLAAQRRAARRQRLLPQSSAVTAAERPPRAARSSSKRGHRPEPAVSTSAPAPSRPWSRWAKRIAGARQRHIDTCESCQAAERSEAEVASRRAARRPSRVS
jgi:hypothetical protein